MNQLCMVSREDPHVVFLQEVIPGSEEILQELCPLYHMIPGNDVEYYTAVMVKIGDVLVEETKILPFPNSVMLRNLLSVKVGRNEVLTNCAWCTFVGHVILNPVVLIFN